MKCNKLIILSVFLLFILAPIAFSQVKLLTEEEYWTSIRSARSNVEKIIYREKSLTKKYVKGKLSGTVTRTLENLPPNRSRQLTIEKEGISDRKVEIISIEDVEYSRENDGDWKKIYKGLSFSSLSSKEVCKQYTVEEKTISNQRFKMYSLFTVYVWEKEMTFDDYRVWIDSNGIIQKVESVISELTPNNITSETVRTYEFNPKDLKIEAPIK